LVIGFINHLQVVTTNNYYTIVALHNLQSLHTNLLSLFPLVFTAISWQRVYNTGTIKVSLNYTLPISLYYYTHKVFKSHVKSSQADFLYSSVLLKLTACLLYSSSLPLYSSCLLLSLGILLTYIVVAQTQTYRKQIM
jgi:hypothetical protein